MIHLILEYFNIEGGRKITCPINQCVEAIPFKKIECFWYVNISSYVLNNHVIDIGPSVVVTVIETKS